MDLTQCNKRFWFCMRICIHVAINSSKDNQIKRLLHIKTCIIHPTVCIRRKKLIEIGGYRSFKRSEDLDLWIRMRDHDAQFIGSKETFINYRLHNQSMSSSLIFFLRVFLFNPNSLEALI